jgi:hypothetical protein
VLERAAERGELPAGVDLDLVHDALVAPLLFRWLVTDGPVDDAVVAANVDLVLAGVGALTATAG